LGGPVRPIRVRRGARRTPEKKPGGVGGGGNSLHGPFAQREGGGKNKGGSANKGAPRNRPATGGGGPQPTAARASGPCPHEVVSQGNKNMTGACWKGGPGYLVVGRKRRGTPGGTQGGPGKFSYHLGGRRGRGGLWPARGSTLGRGGVFFFLFFFFFFFFFFFYFFGGGGGGPGGGGGGWGGGGGRPSPKALRLWNWAGG